MIKIVTECVDSRTAICLDDKLSNKGYSPTRGLKSVTMYLEEASACTEEVFEMMSRFGKTIKTFT